jgi:hypothetical protein
VRVFPIPRSPDSVPGERPLERRELAPSTYEVARVLAGLGRGAASQRRDEAEAPAVDGRDGALPLAIVAEGAAGLVDGP